MGTPLLALMNALRAGPSQNIACLPKSDCPKIRFYDEKDWLSEEKTIKSDKTVGSIDDKKASRGKGQMREGINVTFPFLEDENGVTLTGHDVEAIRAATHLVFSSCACIGGVPETWGGADLEFVKVVTYQLRDKFPCFRYCSHDWKAIRVARNVFQVWRRGKGKVFTKEGHNKENRKHPKAEEDVPVKDENGNTSAITNPAADLPPTRVRLAKHTIPKAVRFVFLSLA